MSARRQLARVTSALLVTLMVLLVALATAGVAEPAEVSSEEPMEGVIRSDEAPTAVKQGGGMAPQVTPYFVRAVSGPNIVTGQLSPKALQINDTLAEIQVQGPMFPRRTLTRAGVFTMQISLMKPLVVNGIHHVSVWAKSMEDAQNAEFRILFQKNGNTFTGGSFYTNRATLSAIPMEFTVPNPPPFEGPIRFNQGETIGIEIQYRASSRYIVGPAPGCTILANTPQHPTRIELLCSPMDMNVSSPNLLEGRYHIQGRVWDTSDLNWKEDLLINLQIIPGSTGTIPPDSITLMNFVVRDRELLLNWTWDFKKATVIDGLFELRIDVSYGVIGHNYTNSTFEELKFPKEKQDETTFTSSPMFYGIIVVVVIAALVGYALYRRSSRGYPGGYARGPYPPPPPPPKKRKKAKKPKPTRAQRKAMKKGLPPPGHPRGPPAPGRTPMPGQGPPGARAPPMQPGRAPPRPQGAPGAPAAKPRR